MRVSRMSQTSDCRLAINLERDATVRRCGRGGLSCSVQGVTNLAAAQASHNESCEPHSGATRPRKEEARDEEARKMTKFREWMLDRAAKLSTDGSLSLDQVESMLPPDHPFLVWISSQHLSERISIVELGAACEAYAARGKPDGKAGNISEAERLRGELEERVGDEVQVVIKAGLMHTQLGGRVSAETQQSITDALGSVQAHNKSDHENHLSHRTAPDRRRRTSPSRGAQEKEPKEPSPQQLRDYQVLQRAERVFGKRNLFDAHAKNLGFGSAMRGSSSDAVVELMEESGPRESLRDTGERRVEPADSSSPYLMSRGGVVPLSDAISTVGRSPPHTPNVHISLMS